MSLTCAACQAENREGRRFCARCGVSLALACAHCGAANEPEELFCGECGAPLLSTSAPTSAPRPPSTAGTGEGERKQLTVLFADVQGSMDLQEHLDPEAWSEIMGDVVRILAEGVRRFGGTVGTFTGDGIMALFGAPIAQEDHARRACHAARHLTETVGAYAEQLLAARGVDLHVRLGLNSGQVMVGRVGEDLGLDPTALGHTVGLAQRMEALAVPGRVYCTEHTARLVEGWFRLADLGPVAVKGASEPLRVFVVEEPVAHPPILRGAQTLGTSPLVGRERELAVLDDALAAATEGRAQVVGVVGDAGLGKSRLCDEFARACAARGLTVRRTSGVSHGGEFPLLPILGLLREYFSITDVDEPARAREKIATRLVDLDPDLEAALPLLFDLLEVADPERPAPPLAPDVRMRRILDALHRVTQRRSQREVLVLVVEDVHWFDPQSRMFLERLIESFPGSRTLVVANFRPEFTAPWMRHSYYRQLPLAPLRDAEVGELLGGLLGTDLTLASLLDFVRERTGGNPFFVEEVVRTLVEDGTLSDSGGGYRLTRTVSEITVPPTVQAVLAARIDRLAIGHKAVLQTAAVIGRTFSEQILAAVTALDGDTLAERLRGLCAAELLQQIQHHDETEYRFWHPLTQEVAYGTLLAKRRARLHAAVAEAIEAHDRKRLPERAAEVAGHWERAGRMLDSARWNTQAGRWALRTDVVEALRRWQSAIDALVGVDESPEALRLEVEARTRLLQFGARTGLDPVAAERIYSLGRARAEKLGDETSLALLISEGGLSKLVAGELRQARDRWAEAAGLASQVDPALRALLWENLAFGFLWAGPLDEGLHWIEQSVAAVSKAPQRAADLGASLIAAQFRANLLSRMGRLAEAQAVTDETVIAGRADATPEQLMWSLAVLPELAWTTGEPGRGVAPAEEALTIAEETGNLTFMVVARQALALAHLALDQPGEALAAAEQALAEARTRRLLMTEPELLTILARARLAAGDPAGSETVATEAIDVARREGARAAECPALLVRAQARRAQGAPGIAEQALADLEAALDLVTETGAVTYEPFIREELGRLRGAETELRGALELFTAIGATGHARRLAAEIDSLALAPPWLPR